MPSRDPQCLNCVSWEDQYNQLVQDYEIADRERRRALRKVVALERELHGSVTKESDEIREVLNVWDELRQRLFKNSKPVNVDMNGDRAKAVRSAKRRGHAQEDLLRVPFGASLSQHHVSKREFFEITSLLGLDKRIEAHAQRARDYERLRDAGFDEQRARVLIHAGVDKQAHAANGRGVQCPGCGADGVVRACFCDSQVMRTAA